MTRRIILLAIALLCIGSLILLPGTVHAQTGTDDEAQFWTKLQRTAELLRQATESSNSSGALSSARNLWSNTGKIRTSDGTVIAVDLSWLRNGLQSNNPSDLKNLSSSVQAVLDYHRAHPNAGAEDLLATLNSVLADPRFHYISTPTPEPQVQQPQQQDPGPPLSVPAAQWIMLIVGVLVVGVLVFNFLRQLQIQRANLPEVLTEDDPTTSENARDRAGESEATQDYRAAIRYLYLASLLLLDERGVLHYDRTLTNREHLRQVANQTELSSALRPVVNTFDRVWYGFAVVNEAMYEQFRQDVERLRSITP